MIFSITFQDFFLVSYSNTHFFSSSCLKPTPSLLHLFLLLQIHSSLQGLPSTISNSSLTHSLHLIQIFTPILSPSSSSSSSSPPLRPSFSQFSPLLPFLILFPVLQLTIPADLKKSLFQSAILIFIYFFLFHCVFIFFFFTFFKIKELTCQIRILFTSHTFSLLLVLAGVHPSIYPSHGWTTSQQDYILRIDLNFIYWIFTFIFFQFCWIFYSFVQAFLSIFGSQYSSVFSLSQIKFLS